ncbi:MAG: Fe-S cluster assembly protein SufD [Candidatus Eisenbacteria bacterium]|nr:Fe-S cluster assembly protein SufD [Candidatus Eisenbacteria bacterium]
MTGERMIREEAREGSSAVGSASGGSGGNAGPIGSGSEWLKRSREEAWKIHDGLPMPDRARHLWRYTDPAALLPEAALIPRASVEPRASAEVVLSESARRAGAIAIPLVDAIREDHTLVREKLGALVPSVFGKPEALNMAAWSAGHFVHLPGGVRIEDPIRLISAPPRGSFRAFRHLILVEEGAEATIVDESRGPDGRESSWASMVTELFVGEGARVRYVRLQRLGRGAVAHATFRARLGRDASLRTAIASIGGGLYKADLGVLMDGEGAESRMSGFVLCDGAQRADHHTVHDHRVARTHSDINLRVVLGGRARSAYTGLIRIAEEAPYCEAFQENRNLLLSDGCRAESIPELEILTDEVRCKHGATAGPIDEDQLFYLESRGLSRAKATEMVILGFLEETLSHLGSDETETIMGELAARAAEITRP